MSVDYFFITLVRFISNEAPHIQKKDARPLFETIAVINSIISQDMAEPQEFTCGISRRSLSLFF